MDNWGEIILLVRVTWRIIPVDGSVVSNHGDLKSPRPGVVGPLLNGFMA